MTGPLPAAASTWPAAELSPNLTPDRAFRRGTRPSVRHSHGVTARTYGAAQRPLAIAHRGGAGLAPENTMAAFERSYALGIRYLETDIRITADGRLVAFHDRRLHRVTGRRGSVDHTPLTRIRELRVFGREPVPTLDDLLDAFPDACFAIDVKERAAVEPLARCLRARRAAHRVCVAGSWDSWLTCLGAEVGPELTVALGWRSLVMTLSRMHLRRAPGAHPNGTFAHVPLRMGRVAIFADHLVERAHEAGLRLIVWTVNDQPTMHRLLDAGVDGVITDRPDLLREVLIARDEWHRDARPVTV